LFKILHDKGEVILKSEVAFAIANGWSSDDADELGSLGQQIGEGKNPRVSGGTRRYGHLRPDRCASLSRRIGIIIDAAAAARLITRVLMTTQKSATYKEVTQRPEHYVQHCADLAADTTHGYKKKEAVLRADGAIRFWMTLYLGIDGLAPEAQPHLEHDLVRLREFVQKIPTDDQA
jgi:hypothetical protein